MTDSPREPVRTCLGCRQRRPKSVLLRLTRGADGLVKLEDGVAGGGRGAYICPDAGCAQRAVRGGRLGHALRAPCRVDTALVERVRSAVGSARR